MNRSNLYFPKPFMLNKIRFNSQEGDKASHDLHEVSSQLQTEQQRAVELSAQLAETTSSAQLLAESEERARDLGRENAILRESNTKLLDSAYSAERERQFQAVEAALKLQVAQLDTTLKTALEEKQVKQLEDA